MIITNEAELLLKEFLEAHCLEGIRLTVEAGDHGPQFSITFDEPQEFDVIRTIRGIRVAVDAQLTDTDLLVLDAEEGPGGRGIVLRS